MPPPKSEPNSKRLLIRAAFSEADDANASTHSASRLPSVVPNRPLAASVPAYHFRSLEDMEHIPSLKWQVEDYIPERGLVMLFGPPGVGKSFIALDLAFSIASGKSWHGHKTICGEVVWICSEDFPGTPNRVKAWRQQNPNMHLNGMVSFVDEAVFFDSPQKTAQFRHDLRTHLAGRRLALLVVDTLAASNEGTEENANMEMGKIVSALKAIGAETGAAILILHHPTKANERVLRGAGSLAGAMDVILRAHGSGDAVTLAVDKMKNGAIPADLHLRRQQVVLGTDEEGKAVTSCVMIANDGYADEADPPPTASHEDVVLATLRAAPDGISFTKLRQESGLSEPRAASLLKRLQAAGVVTKGPGKQGRWTLVTPRLAEAA